MEHSTVSPIYQVVYEGSVATFTCLSKSIPKWSRADGMILGALHDIVLNTLILYNVVEEDSGIYICEETQEEEENNVVSWSLLLVGGKRVHIKM